MVRLQPMTLYELLSLVISIAGFVTVIISLVLLTRQTREMTVQSKHVASSLEKTVYETSAGRGSAVTKIFIDDPEMRPYFYSGKDISEDDPNYDKAIAVADFVLDFFDYIVLQPQHFSRVYSRRDWEPWMKDMFANSPVLCRHLSNVKGRWHSEALVAIMREAKHNDKLVARAAPNSEDESRDP